MSRTTRGTMIPPSTPPMMPLFRALEPLSNTESPVVISVVGSSVVMTWSVPSSDIVDEDFEVVSVDLVGKAVDILVTPGSVVMEDVVIGLGFFVSAGVGRGLVVITGIGFVDVVD